MPKESVLSSRTAEVLNSIVEAYIRTGEPVASRTVSRLRKDSLSPATIRNVMADLSEGGYLDQPHTSAGRVPTAKAFRFYVRSLAARRLPAAKLERLRTELAEVENPAELVERSSHFLTEITLNVGIAAAIPASSRTLDQIQLLKLAERRVLIIVITRDAAVHNRVVLLAEELGQDELNSIRNYVNQNFSGWVLEDARRELEARLRQESAAFDAMMRQLTILYAKGLLAVDVAPEIHMEGASNLVGLDLHLTREKLRELFRALEEKKRILELLDRFMEQPPGELGVQVGLGEAHPSLQAFSLIGINVILPSGLSAKMAVLGPMRMNYGKVISAVLHVGSAFPSI